ncbi:hypothetical protein M3Y98_00148900 [Aphelenchoides besseyi]|nr:hypothetical protein M3Y98_00148900 [Aphelenchoides besseyi]
MSLVIVRSLSILLLLMNLRKTLAIDPLEGIVREFAYAARSTIQQALNQFSSLKIDTSPTNTGISFQTDDQDTNERFRCPLCHSASSETRFLLGTWNLILWSRSFRLTTMNNLNTIIDKLSSNRPIYTEQSFKDLLSEPPDIRCPRITLANDREGRTKFELAYQLLNGRQKSIFVPADGTYFWRLAPTINTRLCIAYTNMGNQSSDYDFIVFNQIDSWPTCSNFFGIARTRTPDLVNNLRDFLEQQQVEGPLNKIEKILCPRSQEVAIEPIIVPVPEDPFSLPNNRETNGNATDNSLYPEQCHCMQSPLLRY